MQRIKKTIQDFLSDDDSLPSVAPDDPVTAAASAMTDKWDCVLVMEGDALVGIFTERDFLNRVAAEQRDPATTKMRDVMTPNPEALRTHDSIAYAINRMVVRGFRNVPVTDGNGKVVSVIDVRDVMSHLNEVFGDAGGGERDKEWDAWTDIGGGA
ncbi:CBS domain-containing protein [Haliangium sp.]|uniref:CBS domain-containing protein n=1 Tax=Haliangium sp. TaxID=2663208 RepID=UPI003D125EEB